MTLAAGNRDRDLYACHDLEAMTMHEAMNGHDRRSSRVVIDGHLVEVTDLFDTYWYLAAERQAMFFRRVDGRPAPWTQDSVLRGHRFTNAYRASDRVSQYLMQRVIYNDDYAADDVVFRVLLFKLFNRIDTWEHLVASVGEPTLATFDPEPYSRVLDRRFAADKRLYSAAYIMPSPQLGHDRKHANHLHLLDQLIRNGTLARLATAPTLAALYDDLRAVPSFGPFLAFQYAIDLNYSECFDFDEMDFVVPGPGALRGITKCFASTGGLDAVGVIRAVANSADRFLSEHSFRDLWGRPLQLIDCQNLFCEVDKYARVSHPHLSGGGPTRIKQTYAADRRPLSLGYPPKWRLPYSAASPTRLAATENLTLL